MRRAAPEPAPQRSSASCAAATTAGCCGEPEVVVRRERARPARPSGASVPVGPGGVEVARRRATGPRRGSRRLAASAHVGPVVAVGSRVVATSSIASCERVARCGAISSDVIVSGGMRTTTSPSGRSSTPRSTAAGARPAGPSAGRRAGGASSTPPIRPRRRTSRDRGQRRDAVVEQVAQLARTRSRTLASTSHASMQLEVAQRDRGGERVPAVGVPVVQRRSERSGPRNASNTRPLTRRSPTSAGSRR